MQEVKELAPNYRRACLRWSESPLLERHEEALNRCFTEETHGLVEHVKSFVECVCLTVINDYGKELEEQNPSLTHLLKIALEAVGYEHPRRPSHLGKMLSAFNKLADALSDMRNHEGEVAHGKDAFIEIMSKDYSRAFLFAGDAILGVLLNALDGTTPNLATTRQPYERFGHFNARIDNAIKVETGVDATSGQPMVVLSITTDALEEPIEIAMEVSQALYYIDREAYIEVLRSLPDEKREPAEPLNELEESAEPVVG